MRVASAAVTSSLPASARLAWWGTAWSAGHVVTDLLLDEVVGDDVTHAVAGLAGLGLGGSEDVSETLLGGLARLRAEGVASFGAAFPVEGDPVGLGGPPDLNRAAIEAGEAVVVLLHDGSAVGLVPERVGPTTTWVAHRGVRRQLPDVGEADRGLRSALLRSADALAALDVARWRPEVADRLTDLRHRDPLAAPPGVPERCVSLAARALHAWEVVELALEDDGGALSLHEITRREQAILPLGAAARRALVAACSPEVWPPA